MDRLNEILKKVIKFSKKKKLNTVFLIGNTIKKIKNDFHITPIRIGKKIIFFGVVIYKEKSIINILKKIDGKVDFIFVDAEKKIPNTFAIDKITANLERSVRERVIKSKLFTFKGNDLTVEAVNLFLTNYFSKDLRGVANKKISIIGSGNIGSKLALKLIEQGANITITRRNKSKLKLIVKIINLLKPENTKAVLRGLTSNMKAAEKADVLIATNDGKPIINKKIL